MAFVSPLSLSQLEAELDDTTRNLTRVKRITSGLANQTTTSTSMIAITGLNFSRADLGSIDALVLVACDIVSDISNSGANDTVLGVGQTTEMSQRRVLHNGATPRTSRAQGVATIKNVNQGQGEDTDTDNVTNISLFGRVSAGTGNFNNNTLGVTIIRGAG